MERDHVAVSPGLHQPEQAGGHKSFAQRLC
jgi:hypothetical protein